MLDAESLLDRLLEAKEEGQALLLAFVGAGGKTEAIFSLARQARSRGLSVIISTTTAMRDPRLEDDRGIDFFIESLPMKPLAPANISFLATGSPETGKIHGPAADSFKGLRPLCDLILVEADGSRRLPIKAPAPHEPVLPEGSDIILACVGLDALGLPAEEGRIHRFSEFLAVTGLEAGQIIDGDALARLASHPQGSFKSAPEAARRILLLCKADLIGPARASELEAAIRSKAGKVDLIASLALRRGGSLPVLADEKHARPPALRPSPDASAGKRTGFVLVRGGGDLATGVIVRLRRAGFRVGILETEKPSAIRRTVSFSEAVYEGQWMVEGLEARRVGDAEEFLALLAEGSSIPLLVDPEGASIDALAPAALVDAIMAKENLGTRLDMAPNVIALGPGFEAGVDCQAVIETNRGHDLGRVMWKGRALPDTGQPGEIGGATNDRVIRSDVEGVLRQLEAIGSTVIINQVIAYIENNNSRFNVYSKLDGILRGMIRDGYLVKPGLKIADVDPRGRAEHCQSVSDKARAIGGSVLEALLALGLVPEAPLPGAEPR